MDGGTAPLSAPTVSGELVVSSSPPPTSSLLLPFVDPPLLSCTMQKRSPATPAIWQVRHFILYSDLLLYSTTSSPSSLSSPLGLIPLSSIIYVTSLPSSPLRFDFIVQADKSRHTFQLLTGSSDLTQQWVRRMRRLTKAGNAGRVGDEESSWYDRKGKFWKNVTDIAMRRRVRRAHAEYERSHPLPSGPSTTAPLLSGFIRKKSPALLQLWQSRYFVLYPAVIVYSRSMGSDMLGALAVLSIVWMDRRDECRLDISVEAEDGTGLGKERLMLLQMDSDEERDMWYSRISQQLAIIRLDHSSASHSRSMSAAGRVDHLYDDNELQPTDDVKPGTLLFSHQRRAHAHTPYVGARDSSSASVPALQSTQQQPTHLPSPPLPLQDHSKHRGLSPPSFLNKLVPHSPLSIIKQSQHIASQWKAGLAPSASQPRSANNTSVPLTATLGSITTSSLTATTSLLAVSGSASLYTSPLSLHLSSVSPPTAAAVAPSDAAGTGLTTMSASCYTDRPTSAVRPLIKRLADDYAHAAVASCSVETVGASSPSLPAILPASSPSAECSRSRSASTSRSASSPPPPSGGLLDEGITLTLFTYTAEHDTLSLCDVVLSYCEHSHTLTCRPADAAIEQYDNEHEQQQPPLVVGVDELESAAIGRHSATMRRLSLHISADCCLTVSCAGGDEINVVAKGGALIKLLHKELSILIGDVAADEQQQVDDTDSVDRLADIEPPADDKLDEAEARVEVQPVTTSSAAPSLAPYLSTSHLVPILSTSPNLSRSRSAPAGATLRFQDRIEVHEYVQPASYTPSQEEEEEARDGEDDMREMSLTYCQHDQDDDAARTDADTERSQSEWQQADQLELTSTSESPVAVVAGEEVAGVLDCEDTMCVNESVTEVVAHAGDVTSTYSFVDASCASSPLSSPSVTDCDCSVPSSDLSAAVNVFGVQLRSVNSRTAATSTSPAQSALSDTGIVTNAAGTNSDDVQLPDAPELTITSSVGASNSNINLTVDFEAPDSAHSPTATRCAEADVTSSPAATHTPTRTQQHSLRSIAIATARQSVEAEEDSDQCDRLTKVSSDGRNPFDTSSFVFAPAAHLLPSPSSTVTHMHRAVSTPSAPSPSSVRAAPVVPPQPLDRATAAPPLSSSGGVSVSALKSLWQQKSEVHSPTASQPHLAHSRR